MFKGVPLIRKRPDKRFATTSVTNEIAGALNSMAHGGGIGQIDDGFIRPSSLVLVKNTSGDDVKRFGVLGIDDILFSPAVDLKKFKSIFAFKGVTPTSDHVGKFVVVQEAIKNGKIGRAIIDGITVVKVNLAGSGIPRFADITEGQSYLSAGYGSARILYRESGTGQKWAVVRLGVDCGVFPVKLTQSGGADGDQTTAATWTYIVKDLNDSILDETDSDPIDTEWPRSNGEMTAATKGIGWWDINGNLAIVAFEVPGTGPCSS